MTAPDNPLDIDPEAILSRALKGLRYDDPYPEADIAFLAQFAPDDDLGEG